jgi:hypothetical protein
MDKEALLKQSSLPEDDVELDGVGTVRVRALSRYEIMLAGKTAGDDPLAMEQTMISMAMVDPKLTKGEVERWQKISPIGQMQAVTTRINELSGVGNDAQKEAYKSLRDDAEPGV